MIARLVRASAPLDVMPLSAGSASEHGDVVADDELHQIFAHDERTTVGGSSEPHHIADVRTSKDDVRVDGQLRLRPRE